MAQKVNIVLTDDLDGSPAAETVSFSLDGTSYELDLNNKNAAAMRKSLERYIVASRKVRGSSSARGRARRSSAGSEVDPKAVRAWASSNKVSISPRGRIPADVIAKFRAAGN